VNVDKTTLEKRRKAAAKLKPAVLELPSHNFRCLVTAEGQRKSFTDPDPVVAHAKAMAWRSGIMEKKMEREMAESGNVTLYDAIEFYISSRENVLSPTTVNSYYEIRRNRFPELMKTKIKNIDKNAVQAAVNAEASKVGHKTIKNALGLVCAVMAEYDMEISTKRIRLPQKKNAEHAFLQEDGLIALFDAIQGNDCEVFILLAVWLGMRRSEILGLCWDSVDFQNGKINVQRTYVRDKENGYVLRDEMKTASSRRILDCPGYILQKMEAIQPDVKKRKGRIFTMHPNTPYEVLKDICRRNGIEFVGIHGLRHTNASVMLSLGVMDKYVMAQGGWSTDYTMKRVYQHIFQSGKDFSTQKRDDFFENISAAKSANLFTEVFTEK
jgi:integrase